MSSKNITIYEEFTHRVVKKKMWIQFPQLGYRNLKTSAFLIFLLVVPFAAFPLLHNTSSLVSDHTIDFQYAAETPSLTLTYYSLFNDTPTPVKSGDNIFGDHIVLNATWTPSDNVNGTVIQVNATAIPNMISAEGANNTVEIDTRSLGNNATCTVNVTTWLLNGTILTEIFTEVFIGNFFVPHIELLTPNGGETWAGQHNITWIAWDNNTDDILTYEVLLSADGGTSFQLLTSRLETKWFVWDFSPFLMHNNYTIEVRVNDGIYTTSDKSDATFTAGAVAPTSTTETTSTTQPSTPADTLDLRIALFVAAAIIASAFLSLIVYQQAKQLP